MNLGWLVHQLVAENSTEQMFFILATQISFNTPTMLSIFTYHLLNVLLFLPFFVLFHFFFQTLLVTLANTSTVTIAPKLQQIHNITIPASETKAHTLLYLKPPYPQSNSLKLEGNQARLNGINCSSPTINHNSSSTVKCVNHEHLGQIQTGSYCGY